LKLIKKKNNKKKLNILKNQNKNNKNFFDFKKKEQPKHNEQERGREKINDENNIIKAEEEKKQDIRLNNSISINNINNEDKKEKEIENKKVEINNNIENNDDNINDFIYEIELSIRDEENKEIHNEKIFIDKSTNYLLNLDHIFSIATSILRKENIEYKYGISFKIGYLYLQEKVGSINLLNYDILSNNDKSKEKITKKLKLETNIIKGELLSQKELCLNPQLFVKLTKNYKIIPNLNIINDYNLFSYDKGLKINMKYITIIFAQNKIYDLTFINLDELSYNDDTEIFFDKKNFDKNNSSFIKLYEKEISLIYKGINNLYDIKYKNIIANYLMRRYCCKNFEMIDSDDIVINTKIKNLLINEEQSKIYYDELKQNIMNN
jgi:hypothetical protein